MITTIIFDLSEVYLTGMKGIEKHIEEMTGQDVHEDILHLEEETQQLFHGEITEEAYWPLYSASHYRTAQS